MYTVFSNNNIRSLRKTSQYLQKRMFQMSKFTLESSGSKPLLQITIYSCNRVKPPLTIASLPGTPAEFWRGVSDLFQAGCWDRSLPPSQGEAANPGCCALTTAIPAGMLSAHAARPRACNPVRPQRCSVLGRVWARMVTQRSWCTNTSRHETLGWNPPTSSNTNAPQRTITSLL